MNDTGAVCGGQSIRDLLGTPERLAQPQTFARDQLIKRLSVNILHRNKVQEFAVHFSAVDVVNGNDIVMVQGRGQLRLLNETRPALRIANRPSTQDFDRDFAPEPGIRGQVNFAHSSFTERRADYK